MYKEVRRTLKLLEIDSQFIGAPLLCPLRENIRRGDTVVIKPNMVYSAVSKRILT